MGGVFMAMVLLELLVASLRAWRPTVGVTIVTGFGRPGVRARRSITRLNGGSGGSLPGIGAPRTYGARFNIQF